MAANEISKFTDSEDETLVKAPVESSVSGVERRRSQPGDSDDERRHETVATVRRQTGPSTTGRNQKRHTTGDFDKTVSHQTMINSVNSSQSCEQLSNLDLQSGNVPFVGV